MHADKLAKLRPHLVVQGAVVRGGAACARPSSTRPASATAAPATTTPNAAATRCDERAVYCGRR